MTIWLDAQLPPTLAPWLTDNLGVDRHAVRDLGSSRILVEPGPFFRPPKSS